MICNVISGRRRAWLYLIMPKLLMVTVVYCQDPQDVTIILMVEIVLVVLVQLVNHRQVVPGRLSGQFTKNENYFKSIGYMKYQNVQQKHPQYVVVAIMYCPRVHFAPGDSIQHNPKSHLNNFLSKSVSHSSILASIRSYPSRMVNISFTNCIFFIFFCLAKLKFFLNAFLKDF